MGETLKGKVAVITGSGQGIGKAIATAMAKEGAKIVTNNRTRGAKGGDAETTAEEIKNGGGEAIPVFADVSKFDEGGKLIKAAVGSFGRIDILVNAAGIVRDKMCFNMSFKEWDAVIKAHLYSCFNCSRHTCVPMKEQRWGRIINVTSDAYRGTMGHVNYGAAKGGIVSLTRSMAIELARYGITCNCIAPAAATRMTMTEEVKGGMKKRMEAGTMSRVVYERLDDLPSPEFIPPIVVYLASDYGAKINGYVLGCGGGKISVHGIAEEVHAIYKDYKSTGPWTIDELIRLIPRTIEPCCPPLKIAELDWG